MSTPPTSPYNGAPPAGGTVQAPPGYNAPVAPPQPQQEAQAQLVPVAPPATYAPQQHQGGVPVHVPQGHGQMVPRGPEEEKGFAAFVRKNQQTLIIAGGAAFLGAMFSQGRVSIPGLPARK